jgi:hypothetical protein|tara:strand:- start:480 stop:1217 length:738 start_codon:yes stop_codon:yes gene_type:complete
MIISHKYKYVFIGVPRSGTGAISEELCSFYHGQKILRRHSSYWNYLSIMMPEWKDYHVFSSIRNPMDQIVSLYYKFRNSQKIPFLKSNSFGLRLADAYFKRHFLFAQDKDNSFSDYFLRFYKRPYHDMTVSHDSIDFVIRYENLHEDFDRWLSIMKMRKIRDIPPKTSSSNLNLTRDRSENFLSYYEERTWDRALRVFSPYFNKWGYGFPETWGYHDTRIIDELQWKLTKPAVKTLYYFFYLGKD